ncbi:amino acid ABC transporter permease [Nocardioides islandensis]|jgi:polar amino acid transport system permease protein|uniref:Amino acid ABC transporter permease n=1 Tax=Nocardioides islandensis TaxID=433663 RepID=A0A930VC67_9ACTN|nr:amino acid ABC transporter permease [Nocardioides islandensis]MBF4761886.1 amino acid ABC transporter permease [Nocardioides islandensis]
MPPTEADWTPSARQVERDALRRRLRLRSGTIATVATVVVIGLLVLGVTSSPGWPRVKEFFFSWEDAKAAFPDVLKGFGKNVLLFLIAEPLILLLGAAVAVVRSTTSAAMFPVRLLAVFYTDLFRGVPTILVVVLAGFGIPALQLQGVTTDTFWLGCGALVLSYGAYVAEVFRSGIDSIHPSQVASADALGLSHGQAMRYVVLPQATRRVVPPLLNDFVSLQKDTALLSSIFVFDALFTAQDYASYNFNYTPIVVVAALFVALTIPLARFTDWLGRRMMRRERAGAR